MKLFNYVGNNQDAEFGRTISVGTGQSGTVAPTTTADEVMTNAQAMKITQQTSSGDGQVDLQFYLPKPSGFKRFRILVVWRVPYNDNLFNAAEIGLEAFDGTNRWWTQMSLNSANGVTEEVQYLNDSSALVDTGFNYPTNDLGRVYQWNEFDQILNITDDVLELIRMGDQVLSTRPACSKTANITNPSLRITCSMDGDTNASGLLIDSILVEAID